MYELSGWEGPSRRRRGTRPRRGRRPARRGSRREVLIGDVNDDRGAKVAAELAEDAAYLHLDVRQEADWKTAVDAARARYGHLDVLVNNAAILRVGDLETFSAQDFRDVVEVNQVGPFLGMRAVIPAMRAAGRGSIIDITSTDGMFGRSGVIAYGGCKWALRGLTKIAAQELGPLNIRVNSVYPGGIQTRCRGTCPARVWSYARPGQDALGTATLPGARGGGAGHPVFGLRRGHGYDRVRNRV
jgi:3alpha(or 20beta)-hydroxysteroid dehydrogenase